MTTDANELNSEDALFLELFILRDKTDTASTTKRSLLLGMMKERSNLPSVDDLLADFRSRGWITESSDNPRLTPKGRQVWTEYRRHQDELVRKWKEQAANDEAKARRRQRKASGKE